MSAAQHDVAYLDYRVAWRAGQSRPGKHAARQVGAGGDFRGCLPFWRLPDARRIDIRRTIADPFGQVMVRQTEQRSSITVVLAADVSRSMRPAPGRSCLEDIATLAQAAARSALRAGDAFGVLAFDRVVRTDLSLAPTRARSAAQANAAALRRLRPTAGGAEGIEALALRLPPTRCLVLLASDFLMPLDQVSRAMAALARHDVAPVVLSVDNAATQPQTSLPQAGLPQAGLVRLQDAETGRTRLLLVRPGLRRRWLQAEDSRRRSLDALFASFGRTAFHARGPIDIAALSEHLVGG